MRRSYPNSLLLLVLLFFCGQALALPFINCCHAAYVDVAMGDTEGNAHHGMHMESSAIAQDQYVTLSAASDQTNCNHECASCLFSSVINFTDAGVGASNAYKHHLISNYVFTISSAALENPFRPPISA